MTGMPSSAGRDSSLRERKRLRTRAALIEAGRRLFDERGYHHTTVADIAAAAEVATRTFFSYFESKEQLLFPESDARVEAALAAIRTRRPDERPADVLLRALRDAAGDDMLSPLAQLRLRLIADVPAVQGRALRLQLQAQADIGAALVAAYPGLDPVEAAALVGAFIGAAAAAVAALAPESGNAARNDGMPRRLYDAVASALGVAAAPPPER
jgi:AcrR family transcriptional regulator